MTKIEWVKNPDGTQGITLNPIKGICPIGCSYCYGKRLYRRFGWDPEPKYVPKILYDLTEYKKPTGIFLCSTFEWLWNEIWADSIKTFVHCFHQHRFYLLTKMPERLERLNPYPDNAWIGVSVTSNGDASRAYTSLASIVAPVKFISFEPLRGQIGQDELHNLSQVTDWWIIGAQTPYSKKTAPRMAWVQEILVSAHNADIPVFMKSNLIPVMENTSEPGWNGWKLRQEMPECQSRK